MQLRHPDIFISSHPQATNNFPPCRSIPIWHILYPLKATATNVEVFKLLI